MSLVIETHHLTKRYTETVAVDDLSLEVPSGGVFGLLGPNGSGKTTTISMLLGLVWPTSGTIRLFESATLGVHPNDLRRVGAIVESPAFYPYLSGRANLRYFAGIGDNGGKAELDRLLARVGLGDAADRRFQTYSMGMKQRLGIAYALLGNPDLVFLDEPTNGLDPAGVAEVRELIRGLGTDGRTVILSSHLLGEVQQVADRVAILSRGRLIAQGSVEELLRGREALRLHTTDDARATSILSALPTVTGVVANDGALTVNAPLDRAWELSRALAEEQVYVAEMAPIQTSLEHYFLEITGEATAAAETAEVGS
ncbi:MAG TPA: ABC transporter ATP-binding protein [Thermomicrobiaceae bacterium]|nr:ABC transporter ATP-binding protein [Thermomicrobiaceae bacterium]